MKKELEIKHNLTLFKWQKDVIATLYQHWRDYIHVVKSKRQCGKSLLLEIILLKTAIERKSSTSILLSPTLEQARKIFKELKNILLNIPQLCYSFNEVNLNIQLTNYSQILFRSAEQRESLRGYTVTGIYCIDEAAFIPDNIFYETLAWVNVSSAPVVICSTPKHKTGFFYKYFCLGQEVGNRVISYDWATYDTSALLTNEKLEQYKIQVPTSQFTTEFLGQFLDESGGVFGDFSNCINDKVDRNLNCYMGIDWGSGQGSDYTSISIFNSKREMIGIDYFNNLDETETIKRIVNLIKQYKPLKVQVELNSIGQIFWGLLKKETRELNTQLVGFTTTNQSKERIINQLQVYIQNREVSFLPDEELITELSVYEMKLSNNKHIYNAPIGYHDDLVISTCLALDCINKGNYIVR